jgi:uncharacterized membrane protein (UPF0127 family)
VSRFPQPLSREIQHKRCDCDMKNTLSVLIGGWMGAMLTCIVAAIAFAASDSRSDSMLIIATRDAQHRFTVELARTPAEMERGLMYRDRLAPDHGMLFLYEEERPVSFWMKNTLIPLDLIFADSSGRIVQIAQRAVPLSTALISSDGPVRAVLEVNGGTTDRLGIAVGDRLLHPALGQ